MLNKPVRTNCDILGVRVDVFTMKQSLDLINEYVVKPTKSARVITKPYVEFMTSALRDTAVQAVLNKSALSVPDGVSLQWAASYLYGEPHSKPTTIKLLRSLIVWLQKPAWRDQILPEKFAGITYTKQLLDMAQVKGWRVGVIGGDDPLRIKHALGTRWPELKLQGTWTGYTQATQSSDYTHWQNNDELSRIIDSIKSARLDILCVAMGFPRQEVFMDTFAHAGLASVMIGEGGSFDYEEMGGSKKRAPYTMRRLGLEWLWRLILQPSRIKRQLAVPRFIMAVQKQAKQLYTKESS